MKFLLIEDNPDHQFIITDAIREAFRGEADIHHKDQLKEGLALLLGESFDICLCDLKFPDSDIDHTITTLQALTIETPIIVLTSLNDPDIAKDLIHKGIQDYIPKNDLNSHLLHRVCTYAVERKKHERLLEARNRDQQAFCYSLSHDFKGNLRRVEQLNGILRSEISKRGEISEKEEDIFNLINLSVNSITHLVDGLYQYINAANSPCEFKPVNLKLLLSDLLVDLKSSTEKEFELIVPELEQELYGNYYQLYILFKNLIANGIKFNQQKPVIKIHQQAINGSDIAITVEDNGIGISPKYLSKIFSPFERLHSDSEYEGSGLGLSIVKRILDNHQGQIEVKSEPSQGSQFIITFPIHADYNPV